MRTRGSVHAVDCARGPELATTEEKKAAGDETRKQARERQPTVTAEVGGSVQDRGGADGRRGDGADGGGGQDGTSDNGAEGGGEGGGGGGGAEGGGGENGNG